MPHPAALAKPSIMQPAHRVPKLPKVDARLSLAVVTRRIAIADMSALSSTRPIGGRPPWVRHATGKGRSGRREPRHTAALSSSPTAGCGQQLLDSDPRRYMGIDFLPGAVFAASVGHRYRPHSARVRWSARVHVAVGSVLRDGGTLAPPT